MKWSPIFTLLFLFPFLSLAQTPCTPDPSLANAPGGVYPAPYHPQENPTGGIDVEACVGQPYEFVFTAVNRTITYLGFQVNLDSFEVLSISGLPNGLTFQCNPTSCRLKYGEIACSVISGIPNDEPGDYVLIIRARAYLNGNTFTIDFPNAQYAPGSNYTIRLGGPDSPACGGDCIPFDLSTSYQSPSCAGFCDGTASVAPLTGQGPFRYLWSSNARSQTSPTARNLCAGTYGVTVTDVYGCSMDTTVTITATPRISGFIEDIQDIRCYGEVNGMATAGADGGNPPYAFRWPTGATTASETGLAKGIYTVSITDSKNCTGSVSIQIAEPTPLRLEMSGTSQSAPGVNDGTATANPSGGRRPYNFRWSNGASAASISNLAPGVYSVTVTDNSGCSITGSVTVKFSNCNLVVSLTGTDVSCGGKKDGTATATAVGGAGSINYRWSIGGTLPEITGLGTGIYTVTATDQTGCESVSSIFIDEPSPLQIGTIQRTNVTCFGLSNGSAVANPTGGTPPYEFEWSNGATSTQITGLARGVFILTITDSRGCGDIASTFITQPAQLTASFQVLSDNQCFGQTQGNATVTASGGTPPYSYVWSNGATDASAGNLPAGNYTVTITDAANCTAVASGTLQQPPQLQLQKLTQTNVRCFGETNGAVTLQGSGGVQPYRYNWSTGATTAAISNLPAGNYSATLTDANNCTAAIEVTITQPPVLNVLVSATPVSTIGGSDGSVTAISDGGRAPYNFRWNTGAITPRIIGLRAGTYTVTIADANGCTADQAVVVNNPNCTLSLIVDGTDINCQGAGNGSAIAMASGGEGLTFKWSNGANTAAIATLAPGMYSVTVEDSKKCSAIGEVNISEPPPLLLSVSGLQNAGCRQTPNGAATVTVSGGVAPYSYVWPDGTTTPGRTGLAAGLYRVSVTDDNDCIKVINITIPAGNDLSLVADTIRSVSCFGNADGTIELLATGGKSPYAYTWSNGSNGPTQNNLQAGVYKVTVTDADACIDTATITLTQPLGLTVTPQVNQPIACFGGAGGAIANVSGGTAPYNYQWSNGATTVNIQGIGSGRYFVTVSDAKRCTEVASLNLLQPELLDLDLSATPVSVPGAQDGSVAVTPSGGTAPYSYLWSNGATTPTTTGLAAGEWKVTVQDANKCAVTGSISVEAASCTLNATLEKTNPLCFGNSNGRISAQTSGNNGTLTFIWSTGATTATIAGLSAGAYTVTITDTQGCRIIKSTQLVQPSPLQASVQDKTDADCGGNIMGSASLFVTGGTQPYRFSWPGGQTTSNVDGLLAGSYKVTVLDANDCGIETPVTSGGGNDTDPPVAKAKNLTVYLNATGLASLSASAIDNGSVDDCSAVSLRVSPTTFNCTNLGANIATLTATDANGNSSQTTATITVQDTIRPKLQCPSNIVVDDCSAPVLYNPPAASDNCGMGAPVLTEGLSSGSLFPAGITRQVFVVTDNAGLTTSCAFTVTAVTIKMDFNITAPSCFGGKDGSAEVQINGGTSPYSVVWSNGQEGMKAQNLAAGAYIAQVRDAKGCITIDTAILTQPAAFDVKVLSVAKETEAGNDGAIRITVTGGTKPYTYAWTDSTGTVVSTEEDPTGLKAGDYRCRVTDARGCTDVTPLITVDRLTAITLPDQVNYFSLQPNPVSDRLKVQLGLNKITSVDFALGDWSGKIWQQKHTAAGLEHQWEPSVETLPSGIYWVRAILDGQIVIRKVVVAGVR